MAEQHEAEQRLGYTRMSFNDFILDGKQLAAAGAKVAVYGVYRKFRDNAEALLPPGSTPDYHPSTVIPLLIENATREARSVLLRCDQDQMHYGGCAGNVIGTATMCTKTTLVSESSVPCIDVHQVWSVPPP